jgi:branched-chain amino acid transport system ATP-binding protein
VEVKQGEIVAVVGPNGAGKTTLINAVSGMIPIAGGSVHFMGESIDGVPAHKRAGRGVIQCPEGRKLFPDMTVVENLRLGAFSCRDKRELEKRFARVFELFPVLEARRRQKANTMSGGEQQMVAIGRAMMADPKVILFDEPSLGLAPIIVHEVIEVIQKINAAGTPILLVEQNVHQTLEIAHRAYVIENGRIALEGEGKALLEHEHMKNAYLGIE